MTCFMRVSYPFSARYLFKRDGRKTSTSFRCSMVSFGPVVTLPPSTTVRNLSLSALATSLPQRVVPYEVERSTVLVKLVVSTTAIFSESFIEDQSSPIALTRSSSCQGFHSSNANRMFDAAEL